MNHLLRFSSAVTVAAVLIGVPVSANAVPSFQAEPVRDFQAALQHQPRRSPMSLHLSGAAYHAYRFLDPDMVIVGVASAITVDAKGRVHVVQAHGQPMSGHLNRTHAEYSHVLLPANVSPPNR